MAVMYIFYLHEIQMELHISVKVRHITNLNKAKYPRT